MSIQSAIGSLPPRIVCDRPECTAFVDTPCPRADWREIERSARILADSLGWDIARHQDVPFDFCPDHVDLANKPKVTRLFENDLPPIRSKP